MSSAVYLDLKEELLIEDWLSFCDQQDIYFSNSTVGQNTFYGGQVEISLDNEGYLPKDPITGRPDHKNAKPPATANRITVNSYHGSNLAEIANIAKAISTAFPCSIECDVELEPFLQKEIV